VELWKTFGASGVITKKYYSGIGWAQICGLSRSVSTNVNQMLGNLAQKMCCRQYPWTTFDGLWCKGNSTKKWMNIRLSTM